jgi:hypothetical protein
MTTRTTEASPLVYARVGGLLGLIILASGSFAERVAARRKQHPH